MRALTQLDPYAPWLIRAFFLGYLLLGLWIAPDYGVSWDEPIQRGHGMVSTDYINRFFGIEAERYAPEFELETYEHRHYGVLFTVACFKLERLLGLDTFREYHLLRHYAVFIVFWLGSIGFYLLLQHRFRNWKWALAGMLFLLLCPRIFAHSFFNVKDGVLVGAIMWALYTMVRFVETPRWTWTLAHGFVSAIAIDIRIVAIIVPALTVAWIAVGFISGKTSFWKAFTALGIYGVTTLVFTVAGWPYLWEDPLGRLLEAYQVMGNYQWGGEVRLWGEFLYPKGSLPWYYLPSWMLITIPVGIMLFFLAGLWRLGYHLVKRFSEVRTDAIVLSLLAIPVGMVILKGSVLYDDWRQMYFIYPSFAFLALTGAEGLHRRLRAKWAVPLLLALTIGTGIVQMVRYHPFQHVYFNVLAGAHREFRFDQDYWGLAYKQAFEKLLEIDSSQVIPFYTQNYPGTANHAFLPREKEARFRQVWEEKGAKYYLSNFRERRELNLFRRKAFPFIEPVFFIYAGKTPIIGVYRVEDYWDRVEGKQGDWRLKE